MTLEQLAVTMERASRTMTWLLAAVAALSLLVGGIGIMNITLLSVTERTRRLAPHGRGRARERCDAPVSCSRRLVISRAGGLLGIIIGVVASIRHCAIVAMGHRRVAAVGAAGLWRGRGGGRLLRLVSGPPRRATSIRMSPCAASNPPSPRLWWTRAETPLHKRQIASARCGVTPYEPR